MFNLFLGHGENILQALTALGYDMSTMKSPPPASQIILEFVADEEGKNFVKTKFNDKEFVVGECKDVRCPIETFKTFIESRIAYKSADEACKAKSNEEEFIE